MKYTLRQKSASSNFSNFLIHVIFRLDDCKKNLVITYLAILFAARVSLKQLYISKTAAVFGGFVANGNLILLISRAKIVILVKNLRLFIAEMLSHDDSVHSYKLKSKAL